MPEVVARLPGHTYPIQIGADNPLSVVRLA